MRGYPTTVRARERQLHGTCTPHDRSPLLVRYQYMNVRALTAPTDDATEDDRVALSKDAFKHAFLDNLFCVQGKTPALATQHDYYMALAYTVRDRMLHR